VKRCPNCIDGRWETECCNGSGGCDCQGKPLDMGPCNVCGGTGKLPDDDSQVNYQANLEKIRGLCFIGSGPTRGMWAGQGERGQLPFTPKD